MAEQAARVKHFSGIIRRHFQKLPDGRWSYKSELGTCSLAEGLAATIKPPPGGPPPVGLGDCLLCINWHKRVGCALAYCCELVARSRYEGLKLLVEQAVIWSGTGNSEKGIGLLDSYVKSNPGDPAGYRELARLYDRPDYRGRDKRRAIVLYQRFVELGRASEKFSKFEISHSEERAKALLGQPQEKSTLTVPGHAVAFQCFYLGAEDCFSYGVLTASQIILAKAGYVDPASGATASEMGGPLRLATSILRRFSREKTKKEEMAKARKELTRLLELSIEDLAKDPACVLALTYEQLNGCEMNVDQASGARSLTLKGAATHQLLFPADFAFKAEQCHELLHRKLDRN